ncbi:MFS transporter, DHA2 family, multidrug resistance protein [Alteribacillus persepolensis]|uniref:MFS transporter, DHA2 family, multidrug resistance protein n=1 Tax=Alteribacillus persepolensis TaxID=568899 RepID=A0A1G8IP18_9BACI|nr:MDR family MFS transporter [Alteribacillus persepolensis]SDI20665.1 MFS transporter, DHA2 family, multidrug resistance protein [Alteribacillus persepolensis]
MTDMQSSSSWNLTPVQKGLMIAALMAGAFMGIINETLLATALPTIMDVFHLEENTVQWLTTVFLLTNGIMIPISAFLIERFSTRKLFFSAISLFGIGTLIASIAPNFPMLVIARVIQAAGSGIMLPLLMTVLLAIIPAERRGIAMGMAGIVISFAPAIGPTLSGWLLAHFEWRALFYTVLPIVAVTMLLAYLFMQNVTRVTKPKIDVISIILSSFGFGGILYGFSIVAENGWGSSSVIISIIGGIVVLFFFIKRQLRLQVPMLEFRVFQYRIFTLSLVITMAAIISLIGAETLLPLYMQTVMGYTPLESGLMLLPGAIVIGIMSPVTGYLFDKFGARWLAISGLSIVTVTTYLFTSITLETSFAYLTTIYAIRMFGLSFAMMPVVTSALNQLPEHLYAHGSAMMNTMQQVSASIGTAILVTFVSVGANRYTPDASMQGLPQGEMESQLLQLAQLNGYQWAFMGSTILALIAFLFSLFLRSNKKASAEVSEQQAL